MAPVYFFQFGAFGALMPFLSLYYRQAGLTGSEASVLLSLYAVMQIVSQPVLGPLTDRSGHRPRMLAVYLTLAAATVGLVTLTTRFWLLVPAVMLWTFFSSPTVAVADSVALGEAARSGGSYPRLRIWGSIGFLIVTALAGSLYGSIGLTWAFGLYGAMFLVAAVLALRLPPDGAVAPRAMGKELLRLFGNWTLLRLLALLALAQVAISSHAAFFSVRLAEVGGSGTLIGIAWSVAAVAEIPVWLAFSRITRLAGPLALLSVASGFYVLRWWLTGTLTDPLWLTGLQLSHAITFALFMPTSIELVARLVPPELRSSGQGLLALALNGVASVSGTLLSGWLIDRVGTSGMYQVNALIALASFAGFLALWLGERGGSAQQEVT